MFQSPLMAMQTHEWLGSVEGGKIEKECHSVREFVEKAFECVDMKIKWTGEKGTVDEIGVDATDETRELVKIDPQ